MAASIPCRFDSKIVMMKLITEVNSVNNVPEFRGRLEMALLERLKNFLLELGKGFAFVGNQQG